MEESTKTNSDIHRITIKDKEYVIIGTAHISKSSVDTVIETITNEKPDAVCVELDEQRYKALKEQKKWENLDIKQIIKNKQLPTLIINILLASYQKKLGEQVGVKPGTELLEAALTAEKEGIPVSLGDRDVRITLKRAWNSMGFWQKMKFLTFGLAGLFEKEEVSEEKLKELREQDVLTEMLKEMGKAMPVLKQVLIDERDRYLAEKIRNTNGRKIVAVVGAGHVGGILETLKENIKVNLEEIEVIPPASPVMKIVGWALPVIIIGSIFYIGFDKGLASAGDNALFWVLANGIPSSIGAIIAGAHIVTIISVFFAAPVTSLSPAIGAGYVAAFIQAYFKPPQVKEFQTVVDDFNQASKWWKNKLLKVLLVFFLTSLGSAIGSYVGAYEIIKNIF
ncbi:MAG: conjugal transfer protein TraB [Melioribacteraceae bacterium]|nr:MAG: conjugal transfer protein TraB [Melioribacteraceae bacterium]